MHLKSGSTWSSGVERRRRRMGVSGGHITVCFVSIEIKNWEREREKENMVVRHFEEKIEKSCWIGLLKGQRDRQTDNLKLGRKNTFDT